MYFTFDSLPPENQRPLMITVAPYGPQWFPADYPEDIPVSWRDQIQKAVDCYNAGATVLHIHVPGATRFTSLSASTQLAPGYHIFAPSVLNSSNCDF